MDDSKLPRRYFQFSLRRLMLWIVVWVAYLNVLLRLVAMAMPLSAAVSLTIYLAILLSIRIKWGYTCGLRIALLGTVLALACLAETGIIVNRFTGESPINVADSQWELWPAFFLGLFFGATGFVFVHILVVAVNWIDSLMQIKSTTGSE